MHNLTPGSTSPAIGSVFVAVPDAGDARTAASVATPIQALLDMIAWLFRALVGFEVLNVAINGTINAIGAITTSAGSNIGSGLDVNAARSVNAVQDVNAGGFITANHATVALDLTAGTLNGRRISALVQGTDSNSSYSCGPTGYDHVWVPPSGVLSNARTYSVDTTGSFNGSEITFTNLDVSHNIFLTIPGSASPITTLTLNGTAGNPSSVTLRRLSPTIWTPSSRSVV